MPPADTIFALSSGKPPAAIAVVRVSGPAAGAACEALIGRVPKPRYAAFATLRDPATKEPLDQAVVLWFPAGASETGEDVAELQLHGGRAVIAATLNALGRLPGLRPAEAGEFTRRAFANGRMDLTAVEGLADLIGAETEAQRRQAVRQATGALGKRVEAWRKRLIEALALIEAGLDFPDEGDVPADLVTPALNIARELCDEIAAALGSSQGAERLREGLTIAVAGPPNAGKSTLFNWLAGREVAIVSPHAGTTRDVLEVHLDLGGYPVTVLDTAGLRDSADPVEQEGIRRARARAGAADLVLWVSDAREEGAAELGTPSFGHFVGNVNPVPEQRSAPGSHGDERVGFGTCDDLAGVEVWRVRNKSDLLAGANDQRPVTSLDQKGDKVYWVSALTGAGLPALLVELSRFAAEALGGTEIALVTRARHRHNLEAVVRCLDEVVNYNPNYSSQHEDLIAEELRAAGQALGRLAGRVDVEDVLDVVFRDFCIGK